MNHDLEKFMIEQQQMIKKQQQQIESLLNMQQKHKINEDQREFIQSVNHLEKPPIEMEKKKLKIDPYKILDIAKNYDERSLKKAYLKLANKTHPDKPGGNAKKFKIVTLAYKILLKKLSERDNDKIHNDLKQGAESYIKEQNSDNKQNINMKGRNFNMDVFNREFDDNRITDEFADRGYGDWFKSESKDIQPQMKSYSKDRFNGAFDKIKKKSSSALQKYSEPEELVSMSNRDSIMILGKEKVSNYTGESNGLHYRDLKDAFENSTLIDINNVNISNRENNIESYNRQRKNVKFQMSPEDMKRQALKTHRDELEEKSRIRNLQERDEQSSIHYERIHQRLMGS